MTKKNKVVDLKPKAEKVTVEELGRLSSIVNTINNIHSEVGRIEAQKHLYLHKLATVRDEAALAQNDLEKKYGTSDINMNDGSINYKEDAE